MRRMDSTTHQDTWLADGRTITVGDTFTLPDGPTGTVTEIREGVEHGDPVSYITVRNSLGVDVTRWVPRSGF